MLTTNHKPIVKGTDEGIWRRLHLIAFLVAILATERDVNFRENKLIPEKAGILNWALEGLREYQRLGLAPPSVVVDATKKYRKEMDLVGGWIEECCDQVHDAVVKTTVLYADYAEWANREVGWAMHPVRFGRALTARGYTPVDEVKGAGPGRRGYRGLRLRPSVI
jgi:putative DNA primase/helicase